jgi:hypothetical protein
LRICGLIPVIPSVAGFTVLPLRPALSRFIKLGLLLRLLFQPSLEPLFKAIAGLLELIAQALGFFLQLIPPAAAAAQKLLAHAGAGQGQIIEPV